MKGDYWRWGLIVEWGWLTASCHLRDTDGEWWPWKLGFSRQPRTESLPSGLVHLSIGPFQLLLRK